MTSNEVTESNTFGRRTAERVTDAPRDARNRRRVRADCKIQLIVKIDADERGHSAAT